MAGKRSIVAVLVIICQYANAGRLPRLAGVKDPNVILSWADIHTEKIENPVVPESCKDLGVCKKVSNYPTELAKTILNELKSLKNFTKFTVDKLHETQYSKNLGEMQNLCESKQEILFPQAALKGEWYFILNVEDRYFQGYRIDQCLGGVNPSSSIAYVTGNTDDDYDYQLQCEQEFTLREMVYLDLKNKIVKTEYFNVPSCCSCKLSPI